MMDDRSNNNVEKKQTGVRAADVPGVSLARIGLTIFYCLLIVIVTKGINGRIMAMKKEPPKKPVEPFALKAQVEDVSIGSHRLEIKASGSVRAKKDIVVMPEVSGRVEYVHPEFRDGGSVQKGDLLYRIEQQDYLSLKQQAAANLDSLEMELLLQAKRRETTENQLKRARDTWKISKEETDRMKRLLDQGASSEAEVNRLLVQETANMERIEQLESALSLIDPTNEKIKSGIAAAQAQLEKAEFSLEKTEYRAPFTGRISGGRLDTGQLVAPGTVLARLLDTSVYEVPVPVSVTDLETLEPGLRNGGINGNGVDITVDWQDERGEKYQWAGRLVRVGAELNPKTRQVDAVVEVQVGNNEQLSPGLYVNVTFRGQTLDNVAAIPRRALRDGGNVYLVEDNSLIIRPVDVWGSEGEYTYVSGGLNTEDLLITSVVEEVIPGMAVSITSRNGEPVKAEAGGGDEKSGKRKAI